jgi:hypothetical protein
VLVKIGEAFRFVPHDLHGVFCIYILIEKSNGVVGGNLISQRHQTIGSTTNRLGGASIDAAGAL